MSRFYTHMPFIFPHNGNDYLLFGGSGGDGGREWRLYWTLINTWEPRPVATGTNPRCQECAPSAFVENGMIRLSALVNYKLHQFEGASLDAMNIIAADKETSYSGVVTPTHIIRADVQYLKVADRNDAPQAQVDVLRFGFSEFSRLIRLGFVPSDPDKIVITGHYVTTGFRSVIYSLSQDRAWLIQVNGENVYKCAFGDGKIYYVVNGPHYERHIVASADYDLIPL